MTILVTGATGFVGSAVLRRVLEAGHDARVLVRAGSDRRNLDGLDTDVVVGELRDPDSLGRAVAGCSGLFHVAADYRLGARESDGIYDTNVAGTRNIMLAAAAAGVSRIVYTSSVATLGLNSGGAPADETTPVMIDDMIGHYKRSKFLAEAEVRRLAAEEGLPVVIVNPSMPVGPRDAKPTPTGRMIVEAAAGRMPAYVETGLNVVHVDDVAAGHLLAFESGAAGERYILGGENMRLRQILLEIAAITGRPAPRVRLPHGIVLPIAHLAEAWALVSGKEPFATVDGVRMARKLMFYSSRKAQRELGFAPRPAVEALTDAVEWYRRHGYLG